MLADLDAEVVRIELVTGYPTRRLTGLSLEIEEVAGDPRFATIGERQRNRQQMLSLVAEMFSGMTRQDVVIRGRAANISAAQVGKPDDLLDDPHFNSNGWPRPDRAEKGCSCRRFRQRDPLSPQIAA